MNSPNIDYKSEWWKAVTYIVQELSEHGHIEPRVRYFSFLITPSVDTLIGPHIDADIFVGGNENEFNFIGHATLLSDLIVNSIQNRIEYIKVLMDNGFELRFTDKGYSYLITLGRLITTTDSARLTLMLPPVATKPSQRLLNQ
jgi:hypothetical protein